MHRFSPRRMVRRLHSKVRYRRLDAPILVFQMGKVASSAVVQTLQQLELPVAVHHVHLLNDLDQIAAMARDQYATPVRTIREIERGRQLKDEIERSPDVRWNVISMAREPVARNVSAFFESLTDLVPDARDGVLVEVLREAFFDVFSHDAPLTWFQRQLEPVFGIDVFSHPFPHDEGFQIIDGERARVVILRYEDIDSCFPRAVDAFLGLPNARLRLANASEQKWYASLRDEFLEAVAIPESYLDEMYGSEYARHFYRPTELAAFRSRWTSRQARR